MNQFVKECRREWKRLRVPDPVADEMAADLAADLEEAESEGASREEVLGGGASDPRSFARSWAAERGVIPPPRLTAKFPRRSLMLAATAALTITAAVGAALVIFASPDTSPPVAAIRLPPPPSSTTIVSFHPDERARAALAQRQAELAHAQAVSAAQLPKGALVRARAALAQRQAEHAHAQAVFAAQLPKGALVQANGGIVLRLPQAHDVGVDIHTVGSILLIVGLVGIILSLLFAFWSSGARPDVRLAR